MASLTASSFILAGHISAQTIDCRSCPECAECQLIFPAITMPSFAPPPRPQIEIHKTDHQDQARAGDILTYEITVSNPGETDINDLAIIDKLPLYLRLKNISGFGSLNGNMIIWDNEHVDAAGSLTVSFQAQVATEAPGNFILKNHAKAASPKYELSAEATDTTVIMASPAIRGAATQPPPQPIPTSARTGASALAWLPVVIGGWVLLRKWR